MITFTIGNINYENFNKESIDILVKDNKITQAQADGVFVNEQAKLVKITGKEYAKTGIKISFTKEDGDALLQVKAAFEFGVSNTNIKFSNGSILPMQAKDFAKFALWFVTERNSFFV